MNQNRPFQEGDVVELHGEIGVVLKDETDGLILVRVTNPSETWTAEHCCLVVRSSKA